MSKALLKSLRAFDAKLESQVKSLRRKEDEEEPDKKKIGGAFAGGLAAAAAAGAAHQKIRQKFGSTEQIYPIRDRGRFTGKVGKTRLYAPASEAYKNAGRYAAAKAAGAAKDANVALKKGLKRGLVSGQSVAGSVARGAAGALKSLKGVKFEGRLIGGLRELEARLPAAKAA